MQVAGRTGSHWFQTPAADTPGHIDDYTVAVVVAGAGAAAAAAAVAAAVPGAGAGPGEAPANIVVAAHQPDCLPDS